MKLLLLCALAAAPPQALGETRAVWVKRHDYRSEKDIRTIVANAAGLGFNVILFQVRGRADAYYRSELEPWGRYLGGKDPGFDPLEVACAEAKARGVALHAWVNVLTAWSGRTPPRDPAHPCVKHPEWILKDARGEPQAWNDSYVFFDARVPAVRGHVTKVMRDIVTRYPVAGLHLDYVRYPKGSWGREMELRAAVTATVRTIGDGVAEARPGAKLTAAIFPTAASRVLVRQEAELWVKEGLIEAVYPMLYNTNDAEHRKEMEEGYARFGDACLPGIGMYLHRTAAQTARQVGMCRGGFALYGYSSLYATKAVPGEYETERLRGDRRAVLKRLLGGD